jgi:ER-bound oxygenase mpaB/B'/Rubber oxygenase, catalytic domain
MLQLQRSQSPPKLLAIISAFLALYIVLVRILRYRALNSLNKKYSRFFKDPHTLDYKTAHEIIKVPMLYDLPLLFGVSTQIGLIKTYGIASGTTLLAATRRLTEVSQVGRRAVDTAVILSEFLVGSMDSDRGLTALAKLNWIHGQYGSKITNPEMIHTLAMFVLEPVRWTENYGWRGMTRLEKVAYFVYWKEIGSRMGMTDIPETYDELEIWTEEYEKSEMVYAPSNKACADASLELFLRDIPVFFKGFARNVALSLLEPKVRKAIGSQDPPQWISNAVAGALYAQKMIVRHLMLPRLHSLDPLGQKDELSGRYYRPSSDFEPWYVKETRLGRLRAWLFTREIALPGPQWKSNGYLPEELGPAEYETRSKEPVLQQAAALKKYAESGGAATTGCPFKYNR